MTKPTRFMILLLALQAAAPAAAWDWVRHTPAETTTPALLWMGQTPDGTLWGADYYGLYKLPADGSPASSVHALGELTITGNGEVFVHGGYWTTLVTRLGADLRPRWAASSPVRVAAQVKDDGTVWLSSDSQLTRLNSVGAGNPQASEEPIPWTPPRRAGFAERNPSVLLTPPDQGVSHLPFYLVQRKPTAALDWRYDSGGSSRSSISRDDTRANGGILL